MSDIRSDGRPILMCWRGLDTVSLELMALRQDADMVSVESSVVCAADGGFRLDHAWELTPEWRARSLRVERWDRTGRRSVVVERDGKGWRVNGELRVDLDDADEPDLSVTPFCNTLVIRRVPAGGGASLTVDTAYVNGEDLSVARSRQRYDRKGPRLVRFVDLGLSAGFEADLRIDDHGLIEHYEHLFERVVT
jgi:uncharacterized protein